MISRLTCLAPIFAFCALGTAQAGIIVYDNLGSGSTVYNINSGYNVDGMLSGLLEVAFSFTPGSTSYFTELDIALINVRGPDNSAVVDLMSDSSGSPGPVLESWTANNLPQPGIALCCTLQTLLGNGTIPLLSGTPYWVAVLPGVADTQMGWLVNTTGITGTPFENEGSGWFANQDAGYTVGAFEVQGNTTAAPEPTTLALSMAVGFLTLFGTLKRR